MCVQFQMWLVSENTSPLKYEAYFLDSGPNEGCGRQGQRLSLKIANSLGRIPGGNETTSRLYFVRSKLVRRYAGFEIGEEAFLKVLYVFNNPPLESSTLDGL